MLRSFIWFRKDLFRLCHLILVRLLLRESDVSTMSSGKNDQCDSSGPFLSRLVHLEGQIRLGRSVFETDAC